MILSTNSLRPKILCFVDYYLPGYKAGGPIRTITNMVEHLGDEFEFLIVTRDRDLLDTVAYPNIQINCWNEVANSQVFYASPETFSFLGVKRLLRETPHDVLYLNSFFSPLLTILPLIIRRLGFYSNQLVILAPRGEFSVGALNLKAEKKKIYIAIAKIVGIYANLIWQASSSFESEDILRAMFNADIKRAVIKVAPDFVAKMVNSVEVYDRSPGPLRIIFLSRISPMKNLDYLLKALKKVNLNVELSIFGPIEDSDYWLLCKNIIEELPLNVSATYHGEVTYKNVKKTFALHDVFVFPTRGENFGHVIYEALSVGTSVVVSDQTPWREDKHGALKVISLEQPDAWSAIINLLTGLNDQDYAMQRKAAYSYAAVYLDESKVLEQNRELFQSSL